MTCLKDRGKLPEGVAHRNECSEGRLYAGAHERAPFFRLQGGKRGFTDHGHDRINVGTGMIPIQAEAVFGHRPALAENTRSGSADGDGDYNGVSGILKAQTHCHRRRLVISGHENVDAVKPRHDMKGHPLTESPA